MPTENSVNDKKSKVKQTHFQLKKIRKPKHWREEINNVKQPCWCHEEWSDNHEDGNHEDVFVQVPITPVTPSAPVLDKCKAASDENDEQTHADAIDSAKSEDAQKEANETDEESEEELEEGWQHGWYGPVRCEE